MRTFLCIILAFSAVVAFMFAPIIAANRMGRRQWRLRSKTKAFLRARKINWFRAFDTPVRGCPFCDETVHAVSRKMKMTSPRGEVFLKEDRLGYCCLRCGVIATADVLPIHSWLKVEDVFKDDRLSAGEKDD